jgi:hypothetical protein
MSSSFFQKHFLLFVIGAVALSIIFQGILIVGEHYMSFQQGQPPQGNSANGNNGSAQSPISTVTVTPLPTQPTKYYQRPDFEAGVVYPQWSQTSYGPNDGTWQNSLPVIQSQTAARWLEMPILFAQPTSSSTQVAAGPGTPTPESVLYGIRAARALGFHVFVVPLLDVNVQGAWSASIQFSNVADEQQWFDNFWKAFQPYIEVAQIGGADQVAIGTEEVWLQQYAQPALWNTLIERVRSIFPGVITYDMNWSSLGTPIPSWYSNPDLGMLGVSEYIPMINTRETVAPADMIPLWRDTVKTQLDELAIQTKKPVILSEIGYRNSADTLYHPWFPDSTVSPPDPAEQAAACDAALTNIIPDPHIVGVFFWGWDGVGGFKLSGQPATAVLQKWFSSPES